MEIRDEMRFDGKFLCNFPQCLVWDFIMIAYAFNSVTWNFHDLSLVIFYFNKIFVRLKLFGFCVERGQAYLPFMTHIAILPGNPVQYEIVGRSIVIKNECISHFSIILIQDFSTRNSWYVS